LQSRLIGFRPCLGNSVPGGAAFGVELGLGGPLNRKFAGVFGQVHDLSSDAAKPCLYLSSVGPCLLENRQFYLGLSPLAISVPIGASPPGDLNRATRAENY